jgi:hypothetical protein
MSQKVVLSLAVSVVPLAGIIGLSFAGIFIISGEQSFTEPKKYLIYTSIFLTLFLTMFFIFNIRQEPVRSSLPDTAWPPSKPVEELECVGETAGISPVGLTPVGKNSAGIIPGAKTGQTFSLLHAAERYKEGNERVIIEQNGIHFISSETFGRASDTEDKLDGDFKKLVESVVSKT